MNLLFYIMKELAKLLVDPKEMKMLVLPVSIKSSPESSVHPRARSCGASLLLTLKWVGKDRP